MKNSYYNLILPIVIGALAGLISSFVFLSMYTPSQERLTQEFYDVETAVHVSPHHIRKNIGKGHKDFILVDLRSQQEYEDEHVVGAVSIPAYSDPDTSAYGDTDRIVNAFKELTMKNADKDIIVYCYSIPCMTGRKVGKMLADNDVYVKHLGIGWNEWRYYWDLWNHPHELSQTDVLDFVTSGPEPGEYTGDLDIQPCIEGEFGC